MSSPIDHSFLKQPNRTLFSLALPVLFSLVAEPLTGLADTAFIARIPGSESVAALGVGTVAFSSIFWAFMFLGVGTQTEVAQAAGRDDLDHAKKIVSLAMMIAVGIGFLLMILAYPFLNVIASLLGAQGVVNDLACEYMQFRLLGAPAVLITTACFGALRGQQDMRTPLYVAVVVNLMNVLLDWLLIFGVGSFPALGVAGAALASSISQWFGACWAIVVLACRVGVTCDVRGAGGGKLMQVGGDLFVRTGMVLLFLGFCTRIANSAGPDEGAAYQAIRQFFIFSALFLDAFAVTGQSLVGYFLGAGSVLYARKVATVVCRWSLATGVAMCGMMLAGEGVVLWLLVPSSAHVIFSPAWGVVALTQIIGSLSFATDGIHWGTGDFRFLRNVMMLSSMLCIGILYVVSSMVMENILVWIWLVTGIWTILRAGFGLVRIWPGIGHAPLSKREHAFSAD